MSHDTNSPLSDNLRERPGRGLGRTAGGRTSVHGRARPRPGASRPGSRRPMASLAPGARSSGCRHLEGWGRVPNPRSPVAAGGREASPVRTEGQVVDAVHVAPEGEDVEPALHIPEIHPADVVGRDKAAAVGTERDGPGDQAPDGERANPAPRGWVPDRGGPIPARRGQVAAVGTEREVADAPLV